MWESPDAAAWGEAWLAFLSTRKGPAGKRVSCHTQWRRPTITLCCTSRAAKRPGGEDMPSSEKDRLAAEGGDRWVEFQGGLSDKRPLPD